MLLAALWSGGQEGVVLDFGPIQDKLEDFTSYIQGLADRGRDT